MVSKDGTYSDAGTDEASLGQGPRFQEWSSSLRWLKWKWQIDDISPGIGVC